MKGEELEFNKLYHFVNNNHTSIRDFDIQVTEDIHFCKLLHIVHRPEETRYTFKDLATDKDLPLGSLKGQVFNTREEAIKAKFEHFNTYLINNESAIIRKNSIKYFKEVYPNFKEEQ